jgi:hypothetical protein
VADIFDSNSAPTSLYGRMDIIYAGSFLHLFSYKGKVEVCKKVVKLLRCKKESMLLGRQAGNLAREKLHDKNKGETVFRHNGESFEKVWDEVGELTGTKWRVETEMVLPGEIDMKERGKLTVQA